MNNVRMTLDRLPDFLRSIHDMQTKHVLIGIPESTTGRNDGGESNAQIGYINENGSPANNIPARPFLVPGVDMVSERCAQDLADGAGRVFDDTESIDIALNIAGTRARDSVKMKIKTGPFTPLAPATLMARHRRGVTRTKPLIDTGQLMNSITYVIRPR